MELLNLLGEGKRIINIDGTWIGETNFVRRTWSQRDGQGNSTLNAVQPRVSMIAALDTEGMVWFTLSHANTDSNMMALFLLSLKKTLDQKIPSW